MKQTIQNLFTITALGILTTGSALAEGKGNNNWAEEAALHYEKKASQATANNLPEQAAIYTRMAQIKRDAGASKGGFNWAEYHELEGKLNQLKHKNKKHKPNQGFLKTAKKYDEKATKAKAAGNDHNAKIYQQLADIKRKAAVGKLDNWDEYHALSKQLKHDGTAKKGGKKHVNKKNKAKGNPGQGFLNAAKKYQSKANQAMKDGNEHNARIYTKLANIKRQAAKAMQAGKDHDWTEYFKLQKELK